MPNTVLPRTLPGLNNLISNGSDIPILSGKDQVIYEDSYPNTAVGCPEQSVKKQTTHSICLPDKVLDIDGLGGMIHECQPPIQCLLVIGQEQEACLSRAEAVGDF
jgi:hypothetical protein